jgi:hypothetical protein
MKPRIMMAGVALLAGLLVPLATSAGSAIAGTGGGGGSGGTGGGSGGGGGCAGTTCAVDVWQWVHHPGASGNWGAGGGTGVAINVPPPPCEWNPIGNATSGSHTIINDNPGVQKGALFDVYQSVQQAKSLLKDPQAGEWYVLPVNPAAGAAGEAACLKLPLYYFVPPGGTPPLPPIPPIDLAKYAYNHFTIPVPTVRLSPRARGYVNLASYVWTSAQTETTWASLGAVKVTLTATPIRTEVLASQYGNAYSQGCGPEGYTKASAPDSGPGTAPSCGVLWTAPVGSTQVSVSVTWRVTWGPGGNTLPAITQTGTSPAISVEEIQSLNGG